jgi:hypothetical protein
MAMRPAGISLRLADTAPFERCNHLAVVVVDPRESHGDALCNPDLLARCLIGDDPSQSTAGRFVGLIRYPTLERSGTPKASCSGPSGTPTSLRSRLAFEVTPGSRNAIPLDSRAMVSRA